VNFMSASEQLDKASVQLKSLADRAGKAWEDAQAAMTEDQAQIAVKADAAKASAKASADNFKADAAGKQDEASNWWGEVQSNWKSHIDKVRADAAAAKADADAEILEMRAENAEAAADAAIEFAYAAVEEAEYQVLNAVLARMDADTAATS
jgi:hypothetical protein